MKYYIPARVPSISEDLDYPNSLEDDIVHVSQSPDDYKDADLSPDEIDHLTLDMGHLKIRRRSRDTSRPKRKKSLPVYSLYDVSIHETLDDCWVIIYDKVYDITDFLQEHPGGDELLMEYAGRDATIAFSSVGHSKGALMALRKYLVGVLREEERMYPDEQTWS